jgi:small-conductance mechanosensitive channel
MGVLTTCEERRRAGRGASARGLVVAPCERAACTERLLALPVVLLLLADITPAQLRDTCGANPSFACRQLLERTQNRTLAEVADWVLGTPLTIVLILISALIANALVRRAIERALLSLSSGVVRERVSAVRRRAPGVLEEAPEATLRAERRISALTSILRSAAGFVVVLFAIFMVLAEIGIDVAPLLAGAGVIGVALGFGSQSLVKDFLSGMFILVEDQFGVGDIVDLDGSTSGTVEAVSLRTTRLRAKDGTVWYVPNGAIGRVGNRSQHWSRAVVEIEVAAGTDVDHAQRAVRRVAHALCRDSDEVREQPELLGVETRDAGLVAIRVAVRTLTSDQEAITRELLERVQAEFALEGIELLAAQAVGEPAAGTRSAAPTEAGESGDPAGPPARKPAGGSGDGAGSAATAPAAEDGDRRATRAGDRGGGQSAPTSQP